ncbi:fibroblast growth factor receptor 1 [Aplysia californica]|uniref:Fibroblast growth factor receptor 1 n=1 Tax=Aplysia californica TaxID=6500 RepID=A0ABM1VU80_APLCA|nr:fibroblast growth factor receptor 1 [Aplysia californica]
MKLSVCALVCLLVLLAVCVTDAGKKKCRDENGKKIKRCQVKRDGRNKGRKARGSPVAPFWKKGPPKDKQLIVREGSDVTLNCAMKGRPFPDISWLRNGKSLNPRASKKYRARRTRLYIHSVKIEDTATYTCIGKNKLGHLNFTYSIKVLENMPLRDIEVVDRPENQTAHVGDTVIFLCRSEDWPKPQVNWARKTDSRRVMEVITPVGNKSDVLVLHNVSKADTGSYMCYISNTLVGKQLSARLTVIEEGESLPFEPPCSLHVRRENYEDRQTGCKTTEPLEMHYCMGSCGRSYFVPQVMTSDDDAWLVPGAHLNQPCRCCVGEVSDLRIVHLECPLGQTKRAFYTLLRDCVCKPCGDQGNLTSVAQNKTETDPS